MGITKIEWCDKSWNPITGCSPVSSGCDHCYAKCMANRLRGRHGYPQDDPFRVTFHPDRLDEPLHWEKPSRIFVCSMGDILHDNVDDYWLGALWSVMERCYWHTFLILTKRPQRFTKLTVPLPLYKNLWFGVSVSTNKDLWMIESLLQIPAAKRFVSVEPMLDEINLSSHIGYKSGCPECGDGSGFDGPCSCGEGFYLQEPSLDWVIVGAETGPKTRPMHPDWVRSLRDQCQTAGVPFFFKSWGDHEKRYNKGSRYDATNTGRLVDGREWNEFPQ